MQKTLLITGATDGIGFATAQQLASQGHQLLLHGRNPQKLDSVAQQLSAIPGAGPLACYTADLSAMAQVNQLAQSIKANHSCLDVLINNAGVFKTAPTTTDDGLDIRFAVNTFAPILLTRQLMPLLSPQSRVVNLSSAAQASVDVEALTGLTPLADMQAYAQSKLALTIWSQTLGLSLKESGPMVVAVNPGSLLASKMVKEGFGVAGGDIQIGASILSRAALSDEFANANGQYFDNDAQKFAQPHPDAMHPGKAQAVLAAIDQVLARFSANV